jgi:hypothetical protein
MRKIYNGKAEPKRSSWLYSRAEGQGKGKSKILYSTIKKNK